MRRAGLPDLVRAQLEKSAPSERFVDLSMGCLFLASLSEYGSYDASSSTKDGIAAEFHLNDTTSGGFNVLGSYLPFSLRARVNISLCFGLFLLSAFISASNIPNLPKFYTFFALFFTFLPFFAKISLTFGRKRSKLSPPRYGEARKSLSE